MRSRRYPSQGQLLLPLLDVLSEVGAAAPREVYPAVAAAVGLPPSVREERTPGGVRAFDRHVRWTEQRARALDLTEASRRNLWRATKKGREFLRFAEPGVITVVLRRPGGEAIWADSFEVLQGLEPGSVDLHFTSPPYLLQQAKEYGGPRTEQEYISWFLPFAREMHRSLRDTGSFVLNMGLGPYLPGVPVRSAYVHRLLLALLDDVGFFLAGEGVWHNPATLPTPAAWVTQQRRAVKDGFELVFWLSKSTWPKADNRRVLVPYSQRQARAMAQGDVFGTRPSGHRVGKGIIKDNGGAIPSRVLIAANTSSNDAYQRRCRAAGVPVHPARFPSALPEWWIRYLTEEGDLVCDPFAGSLTTGEVAESLGRRWIAVERSRTYLDGGALRFGDVAA